MFNKVRKAFSENNFSFTFVESSNFSRNSKVLNVLISHLEHLCLGCFGEKKLFVDRTDYRLKEGGNMKVFEQVADCLPQRTSPQAASD
jgi:hypothetical protein